MQKQLSFGVQMQPASEEIHPEPDFQSAWGRREGQLNHPCSPDILGQPGAWYCLSDALIYASFLCSPLAPGSRELPVMYTLNMPPT